MRALVGLMLLVIASVTIGGSFGVAPTGVELNSTTRVAAVTVESKDRVALLMQVEIVAWSQHNGQDVYTPTRDLVATPPLFTVQPGASQVVRLGLRRMFRNGQEYTYRLFIRDVPPPPKPGFSGLRVVLRMSIPVFVAPTRLSPPAFTWQAVRARDGHLVVLTTNVGGTHARIGKSEITSAEGKFLGVYAGGGYLLAGQQAHWQTKILVPMSEHAVRLVLHTVEPNMSKKTWQSDLLTVGNEP